MLQAACGSSDLGGASPSTSYLAGCSSAELEDGSLARAEFPNIAAYPSADRMIWAVGLDLYRQVVAGERNQDRSLSELHRE